MLANIQNTRIMTDMVSNNAKPTGVKKMNLVNLAVKAGAYKQAAEMLKSLRAGELTLERALVIRLSVGWDWEK